MCSTPCCFACDASCPSCHIQSTLKSVAPQVLNILVGGSTDGKGWFFPDGVNGRIKEPAPLNVREQGRGLERWRGLVPAIHQCPTTVACGSGHLLLAASSGCIGRDGIGRSGGAED